MAEFNFFLLHGWMLWAAWTIFAIVQVSSNRYLKGTMPGATMWIHRISGLLITLITLTFAIWAWSKIGKNGWKILDNEHSYFVFPVLFLIVFIVAGGITTRSIMRRTVWGTKKALIVKMGHKIIAYLVILSAFCAVYYGILFYRQNPRHASDVPLEVIQVVCLSVVIVTLELFYRVCCLKEREFNDAEVKSFSLEEFKSRVKRGEKLVILDQYVLDVSWWAGEHPGGTFSIEFNVGRDVSKYFHGGYSLEQNVANVAHSADARKVAEKLIVGRLNDIGSRTMKIQALSDTQSFVSSNQVRTIIFEPQQAQSDGYTELQELQPCALIDPKAMAKHYLVKSTSHPGSSWFHSPSGQIDHQKQGTKRHYTEAFAMRPEVRAALLQLANSETGDAEQVIKQAVQKNNRDDLALTIKNYTSNKGLSAWIHEDMVTHKQVYQIKGPMGKGLDFATGKHVAYAAGTGVLVFMDLVAHLILKKVAPHLLDENQLPDDFQLELYTSFTSPNMAIGVDLIEALDRLCANDANPMFKHVQRYSSNPEQKKIRWVQSYFAQQFITFESEGVRKVWICGPPVMQEEFDRAVHFNGVAGIDFHAL